MSTCTYGIGMVVRTVARVMSDISHSSLQELNMFFTPRTGVQALHNELSKLYQHKNLDCRQNSRPEPDSDSPFHLLRAYLVKWYYSAPPQIVHPTACLT